MLINKKKIITMIGTIVIAISTCSYGADSGVITGETVKLRAGASMEAKLVTLLSVDNKVQVLGQEGDWYKVSYKEYTGYVYKDYVKVNKKETVENKVTETPTVDNTTEPATDTVIEDNTLINENESQGIVVPSEMVIKEDSTISIIPLINSSDVAILKKNTKVTVVEYKNGWVYVVSANANGWIREEKLQKTSDIQVPAEEKPQDENTIQQEPEKTEDNTTEKLNKPGYVNASSVRVRKAATTDSEILENLVRNDKVTIIEELDNWCKVKVNNIEGYIAKQYLSDKEVEVTNRSTTIERTSKIEETTMINDKEEKKTNNLKTSEIVEYAKTFLNYKYVSGGSSPKTGFDCSGFTQYVYNHFGYSINRTASTQVKNGKEISKSDLQLGDLVFFSQGNNKVGHVGIYIGENNFIHAANAKKGVVITSLSNSYYKENYVTARRIID